MLLDEWGIWTIKNVSLVLNFELNIFRKDIFEYVRHSLSRFCTTKFINEPKNPMIFMCFRRFI